MTGAFMRNILTLLFLTFALSAGAESKAVLNLRWASTGSHCVEGGGESLEFQDKAFEYSVWRGERAYAQAVVSSSDDLSEVSLSVSDLRNGKKSIPAENITLQFVSFVTSDLLDTTRFSQCGYREDKTKWGEVQVADILDIKEYAGVPAGRMQPVWVTVSVPEDAKPGKYSGKLTVTAANAKARSLPIEIRVADHVLPPVRDWTFHLDLWQNPYAVARLESVPLWSEEHFEAMRPVMSLLADAGQKSVTATLINRPWNGQTYDAFGSMVTKVRRIDGTWLFDYTIFDRWVEFMFSLGIDRQINCYSMIPWAMEFDFYNQATGLNDCVRTVAGSPEYEEYWGRFIKDFAGHLREKGWFEKTMIAMDERPLDAMKAVLAVVRKYEPDFKVSLAGNYHEPVIFDIADFSEAFVFKKEFPEDVKLQRKELGLLTTFYTCCGEAHPNTFVISDPDESTWLGWFAVAENYDGYLRWAYNSWPEAPLTDVRFHSWPAGDCFIVYPGGRGSVHLAKLTEGIQDYEKIHILKKEWEKTGDGESLGRLEEVLGEFTADKVLAEGAGRAVKAAKSFLSEY